nr:type III-B CRISPR module RAMP protein Cmr6 [Acidobacteriota bacterium]
VHHRDYYQGKKDKQQKLLAPADWDDPNPVPLLSENGTYLVALAAPKLDPQQQPDKWIAITADILKQALREEGIGAKTSSGYGRMELSDI